MVEGSKAVWEEKKSRKINGREGKGEKGKVVGSATSSMEGDMRGPQKCMIGGGKRRRGEQRRVEKRKKGKFEIIEGEADEKTKRELRGGK